MRVGWEGKERCDCLRVERVESSVRDGGRFEVEREERNWVTCAGEEI